MATRGNFLGTGSDDVALALTMYTGAFNSAPRSGVFLFNEGLPFVYRKVISGGGRSHQFLMDADAPEPEDFLPGNEMLGQTVAVESGTITVDPYLVEHTFIGKDQLNISHFEYISRIAAKHKSQLERRLDRRIFSRAIAAARSTSSVDKNGLNVHRGGNRKTRSGATTSSGVAVPSGAYALGSGGATNFRTDLRDVGFQMDEDHLSADRYVFLTPYIKQVVLTDNSNQVFSADFLKGASSGNDVMGQKFGQLDGFMVAGVPVTTSKGGPIPDQNVIDTQSKYTIDGTSVGGAPQAVIFANQQDGSAAVGLVIYEGVKHEVIYQPERLGWLFISYVLCGADVMNPWCAATVEAVA